MRAEAIRRAGLPLGRGGRLDVHNVRGYRNLGNQQLDELQALCWVCHDVLHASRRVRDASCPGTLFWIVVIAIAMQLALSLLVSVLHHFGVF